VGRLGGESVELFGRRGTLCFLLDSQWPFLNHVYELPRPNERP